MMSKTVTSLAFAAAFAVALGAMPTAQAQYYNNELVTNGPQASRGDFGDWSARRNVIESRHYDALLETNWRFRPARVRQGSRTISDPQLPFRFNARLEPIQPMVRPNPGTPAP